MKKFVLIALMLAASLAFVLSPPATSIAQEVQTVVVSNFPKTFNVGGTVSVDRPIKHSKFVVLRDVTVSPVNPKESVRLIQGGIVESDGFTGMVLGLQGQIKGEPFRPGNVGVFLLPDDESIVHAFEEKGLMQFAAEVSAVGVSAASPYFASNASQVEVGFPRYRTYFYNTSDKTVSVNLYAYLTH